MTYTCCKHSKTKDNLIKIRRIPLCLIIIIYYFDLYNTFPTKIKNKNNSL